MERFFVTAALIFVFHFFVVCSAQSTAAPDPLTADVSVNCSDATFQANSSLCCGAGDGTSCVFLNCTKDAETACVASSETSSFNCTDATQQPEKQCAEPAPPQCSSYKEEGQCCSATENCIFFNCTTEGDTPTTTPYCMNASLADSFKCPDGKGTPHKGCEPAPPTCSSYGKNKTLCCENPTCIYLNCTGATADKSSCYDNTTDPKSVCGEGEAAAVDLCHAATTTPAQHTTTPKPSPTTQNGTTAAPTAAPTTPTAAPQTGGGQSFDAASFIGGIVLCAGLVAIGYFGLKFYRARQERNYHTL